MAFKQKPVVTARLDQLSKAELIRTVKKLRQRETKLLNQITALETRQNLPGKLLNSALPASSFPWESAPALPNPFED